jgi:hypothetical protein
LIFIKSIQEEEEEEEEEKMQKTSRVTVKPYYQSFK